MAFSYGKLTDPISITALGSVSQQIYVNQAGTRTYVAEVEFHNWDANNSSRTVTMYIVPASGTVAGTGSTANQMFKSSLLTNDTFYVEPKYPYVLANTGDSIQVIASGTGINTIVKGATE